jgi:transposase
MPKTKSGHHSRYTLAFKEQAVRLSSHPNVSAVDVAQSLGIHVVMLYRWRMEAKNGCLVENEHMKKTADKSKSTTKPKPVVKVVDPNQELESELQKAQRRIKELEKSLALRQEELDILKKARRFFEKNQK